MATASGRSAKNGNGENITETDSRRAPVGFAVLAAALYALSTPAAKWLLETLSPTMLASLLYLGAGIGMGILGFFVRKKRPGSEAPLGKTDLPAVVGMVVLDILAPILLLFGLKNAAPENVSLLNNFEIVATAVLARCFFGERIGKPLLAGIVLITLGSAVLTWNGENALSFTSGSFLVVAATICWGLENNLTRKLSAKDPLQIVVIKGLFSGLGSLVITLAIGAFTGNAPAILLALLLGFVAYGLSIFFYVHSQRRIGAAKTSAFYAVAPFIAAILSLLFFREFPGWPFFAGLALMVPGAVLAARPAPKPTPAS